LLHQNEFENFLTTGIVDRYFLPMRVHPKNRRSTVLVRKLYRSQIDENPQFSQNVIIVTNRTGGEGLFLLKTGILNGIASRKWANSFDYYVDFIQTV